MLVIAVMAATAISAAIRPYSIAVAPRLSRRRLIILVIFGPSTRRAIMEGKGKRSMKVGAAIGGPGTTAEIGPAATGRRRRRARTTAGKMVLPKGIEPLTSA